MREFWRTMTGPKQGVYLSGGTICSSKRFDQPFSPSDSNPSYRRGGSHSERLLRMAVASSGIATVDSAIAVDLREHLTVCQATSSNGLGCLRQSRAGSNCGGLSRENNAEGPVADLNAAADLSYSGYLPFLCAFFCDARAQKCLDLCPTLKIVKETQKGWGASRGDNRVVTGLANCERTVCRVAGLGGLQSGISLSIGPQRSRWTTSFSTRPAGAARAISPAMRQ